MKLAIILAAVTLFGGIAFAEQAEAGSLFPEGEYKMYDYQWNYLTVSAEGDYSVSSYDSNVRKQKVDQAGFALYEGTDVCTSGGMDGNLWLVSNDGNGACYIANVRGHRLIIDRMTSGYKPAAGVWTRVTEE